VATERVQRLDALYSYLARFFNILVPFLVAGTTSWTTASLGRVALGLVKALAINDHRGSRHIVGVDRCPK